MLTSLIFKEISIKIIVKIFYYGHFRLENKQKILMKIQDLFEPDFQKLFNDPLQAFSFYVIPIPALFPLPALLCPRGPLHGLHHHGVI